MPLGPVGCLPLSQGGVLPPQADTSWADPPSRQPLQQKIHILLECILVTTRKRSLQRLYFYTCLSFCPGTRYIPWDQVHPLGPDTPPGTRHTPPDQVHPPGPGTPPLDQVNPRDQAPPPCMLGDTGNKRAVRILLECIFVCIYFQNFFCLTQLIRRELGKISAHSIRNFFHSHLVEHIKMI